MVHNLALVDWKNLNKTDHAFEWAFEASQKMKKYILEGDHSSLINYKSLGKAFDLSVPTPEHYLPLLYSIALREKDEAISLFNDKAVGGSLTMTSVLIGNTI